MSTPGHGTLLACGAGVSLAASAWVALCRQVPAWELRVAQRLTAASDGVAATLWPVMQFGNAVSPLAVGVALHVATGDGRLPIATAAAGLGSWYVGKAVKRAVRRGRPVDHVPDICVREGGSGWGYVSGHAAVAAASATCVAAVLPARWRWVPVVVAGTVGGARLVYGAHLPVDLIGGWALGTLAGLGALRLVGR